MQQQDDGGVRIALAHVVDTQGTPFPVSHLFVVRGVVETGQSGETIIGGAQRLHQGGSLRPACADSPRGAPGCPTHATRAVPR